MSNFYRVLCPVDLSDNSLAAIKLATTIAKESNSKLVFMYVSPLWLPDEIYMADRFVVDTMEDDLKRLEKLRPSDASVGFEHIIENGNAGPEIVRMTEQCDTVVMSTHGYGAFMRLMMGGVAQYIMRNAKCPVVMFRSGKVSLAQGTPDKIEKQFVTELMLPATPVFADDKMATILACLEKARESAAPVVDERGKCIGILTDTDIVRYRELLQRFAAKDETVLEAMFEVNQYGQRRPENVDFHQVKRHMSSPAITVDNTETIYHAAEVFHADPSIHHLIVIDENQHPVGILKPASCEPRDSVKATENSATAKN